MKDLKHLNKYFFKYRGRLLLGIFFVTASNLFLVQQPQIIRQALDLVVENVSLYRLYDRTTLQSVFAANIGRVLMLFGVVVLVLALVQGVFLYFTRQTIIVMSRLMEYDLRNEIYEHYQQLSLRFYRKNNTGDLMARITEDVNHVRMYLGPAVLYGINLVALFVLVIGSMVSVSPMMTFYVLLPLPVLSVSIYYVSALIDKRSTLIQEQLSRLNSLAQEVYSGIRVVKAYAQEKNIGRYFAEETENFRIKSLGLARIDAAFFPLMLLLIGASTLITIYVGGIQVMRGNITAGNIAEFVIYVNMLTWPVTAIGWIASLMQRAAASQRRINEFLNEAPDIQNRPAPNAPQTFEGVVEFRNVSFKYPDTGIQALQNVSFRLEKGEKLAIFGRTGAGKSTLADLLVRMYDVSEGQILLDGRDLRTHDLAALRQRIGYVPQDVFLFSDTVSQNIAFGKPEANAPTIAQYSHYASVHDEIMGLEKGFETVVGERGVTLSGGQKQRISLARALVKQPDLLLLDDCLSAVDTKTEKNILNFFEDALANQTAIIITHRIYASIVFDKIMVLENGRVAEFGTHDALLAAKGFYYELYEKQKPEEVEIK